MILYTSYYEEENRHRSNSVQANNQHQPKSFLSIFLSRQHFAET